MSNIINNIKKNINSLIKFKNNKIFVLLFLMFFFSLLYMLLDDSHFSGVNKFKEIVKEEVIKKKAKQEIKENFDRYYNPIVKEEVIHEAAKEIEEDVENNELEPEKVDPSLIKKYFNRLYFAIITGCLLGYGDIYPVSDICKIFSGLQGLLTVILIIY